MLKKGKFNVYTTDLGEEGVDLGKIYDYDIILLDLNLPDMSGYEVLRYIPRRPAACVQTMAGIYEELLKKIERASVLQVLHAFPNRRSDRIGPGAKLRRRERFQCLLTHSAQGDFSIMA